MATHEKELEKCDRNHLVGLMTHYYVRIDNVEGQPDLDTIKKWLTPEKPEEVKSYLTAIATGVPFDYEKTPKEILSKNIFGKHDEITDIIIEDFSLYPVIKAYDLEPTKLLDSFLKTDNKISFFEKITDTDYNNFLNDIERIFYLTRGYGRPNKNISEKDMKERLRYMKATNTSMLVLNSFFDLNPDTYDPGLVRNLLTTTDLITVPPMYQNAITKISAVTNGETLYRMKDFCEFLKTLGISTFVEYDPINDVLCSNITHIDLYRYIVPGKKFVFEEIADKDEEDIRSIIEKLSDLELMKASLPSGIRFGRIVKLNTLKDFFRANILDKFMSFLSSKKYFVYKIKDKKCIVYGRLYSKTLQKVDLEVFITNLTKHGYLIDPEGNLITLETAEKLYEDIQDTRLRDLIEKTKKVLKTNEERLSNMTEHSRALFKKKLTELPEKYAMVDIKLIVNSIKGAGRLHVAATKDMDYELIPITLHEYMNNPSQEMISNTIEYYSEKI